MITITCVGASLAAVGGGRRSCGGERAAASTGAVVSGRRRAKVLCQSAAPAPGASVCHPGTDRDSPLPQHRVRQSAAGTVRSCASLRRCPKPGNLRFSPPAPPLHCARHSAAPSGRASGPSAEVVGLPYSSAAPASPCASVTGMVTPLTRPRASYSAAPAPPAASLHCLDPVRVTPPPRPHVRHSPTQ